MAVEHRYTASWIGSRGGCCPDFSCCKPELLATPEERRAFAAADQKGRNKFLAMFLGRSIELAFAGKKNKPRVYVTDGTHERYQ